MNWFFVALFAPVLWSITNHIDKYLLTKHIRGATSGALILVSATFGIFALPFILLVDHNIFKIGILPIALIISSGSLYLLGLIPYLYALQKEETSSIVPIMQTIPIFGFIFAFFILGETLAFKQILASILIILGAVTISLDLQHRLPKIKMTIFFYMILASAAFAGVDLLFKFVALEVGFWVSLFWHFTGYIIFAVFVLLFVPSYRNQFLNMMHENRVPILGLNALNEILNLFARGLFGYATLLAPLALVQVVNGFQPFIVFIYGLLLTLFLPHIANESLSKKSLIQKVLAIFIIFIGTFILNS